MGLDQIVVGLGSEAVAQYKNTEKMQLDHNQMGPMKMDVSLGNVIKVGLDLNHEASHHLLLTPNKHQPDLEHGPSPLDRRETKIEP